MKKFLLSVLVAAMVITPLGIAAAAEQVEAPVSQAEETYVPGQAPAQVTAVQAMSPAMHAVLLTVLSRDAEAFNPADPEMAWEAVYNMLSMYGQLDDRSQYRGDALLVPSETVFDYAAAILPDLSVLGQLPDALADRMTYDAGTDCYLVVCGSDGLAQLRAEADGNTVTGSLVYLVDGSSLADFEAVLSPADNLFGRVLTSLTVN